MSRVWNCNSVYKMIDNLEPCIKKVTDIKLKYIHYNLIY